MLCGLEVGTVFHYELFEGEDGPKNRYFIVVQEVAGTIYCLTTTTQDYPSRSPKLATEYMEILANECCLPKRCFVDIKSKYTFDDIEIRSKIRSRTIKPETSLPKDLIKRLAERIGKSRLLSRPERDAFANSLMSIID